MNSSAPDPEALLRHHDFLRSLARALLGDEHLATDAVQQTWLRALEVGPREVGLRSWLSKVLRNLLKNFKRTEARRAGREAQAAASVTVPSAAEIVERESVRQAVVQAVLSLEEPYRTTVLLRYFEDMSPTTIARRLRVPAGTIRTRLHRAHATLRRKLDGSVEGGRNCWANALAPTGLLRAESSIPPSVLKLGALGLTGALLVSAGYLFLWGPGSPSTLTPVPHVQSVESTLPAESAASSGENTVVGERTALGLIAPLPPLFPPKQPRGRGSFRALVMDGDNGGPTPGVSVTLRSSTGPLPPGYELRDDRNVELTLRTNAEGIVHTSDLPTGPYEVLATAPSGRVTRSYVAIDERSAQNPIELILTGDRSLRESWVRVFNKRGDPVPRARVEWEIWSSMTDTALGRSSSGAARTDTSGLATVQWQFNAWSGFSLVTTEQNEIGWSRLALESGSGPPTTVVTVGRPGTVKGSLLATDPSNLRELEVVAYPMDHWDLSPRVHRFRGVVEGNRFLIEGLPEGSYSITIESPHGLRVPLGENLEGLDNPATRVPSVQVNAGEIVETDLELVPGGQILGQVVDAFGEPIADCPVRVVWTYETSNGHDRNALYRGRRKLRWSPERSLDPIHPITGREVRTDATGWYRAQGLFPGEYRIEVRPRRHSYDEVLSAEVRDDLVSRLRHVVQESGVLEIVADEAWDGLLALSRAGSNELVFLARCDSSRPFFTVPGLAHGTYVVSSVTDTRGDLVLAEATIDAGETTHLDLRGQGSWILTGRIVDDQGPVSDAHVVLDGGRRSRTDLGGRFEFRSMRRFDRVWFHIFVDRMGYSYRTRLDADVPKHLEVEIPLGPHHLDVHTLDADGSPVSTEVHLLMDNYRPAGEGARRAFVLGRDGSTTHLKGTRYAGALLPTDSTGFLRLPGLYPADYQVIVTFPNGLETQHQVSVPNTRSITVKAVPTGNIQVTIRSEDGRPMPMVKVRARPNGRENGAVYSRTGPDGSVVLRGVAAGTVELSAWEGMLSSPESLRVGTIEVDSGLTAEAALLWRR